uniref:Uncharacterized protein n=1 Tax=Rhizophagus irregularis (strain DAOM 181602 / DAOM 197198 / MUCL 43194) TaxID=747089 RepID=U9U7X9_RHIID
MVYPLELYCYYYVISDLVGNMILLDEMINELIKINQEEINQALFSKFIYSRNLWQLATELSFSLEDSVTA